MQRADDEILTPDTSHSSDFASRGKANALNASYMNPAGDGSFYPDINLRYPGEPQPDESSAYSTNSSSEAATLNIPYRRLNTGAICPGIGYGTGGEGKATNEELYEALLVAINAGYRSFDSAPFYQDGAVEKVLGKAIRDSGVDRSEFFVTTKIWPTFARKPQASLEMSLENLGLDYVDCLLSHWPIPLKEVPGEPYALGGIWDAGWDFKKTWIKMQESPKDKARAIGVCNFTLNRLRLLSASPATKVVPAVLQVEGHPESPQNPLMRYCREHAIQVFCFSPLAQGQVSNNIIREIAREHGVGAGQVAISWAVQRGTVPLPKSVTPERIRSNIQLVELDEDDMNRLAILGRFPRRIVNPRILFGHDIFENNADSYEDDVASYDTQSNQSEEDEVENYRRRKRR